MSVPFSMEWRIITGGKEKRISESDNLFEIEFDGYKLFPIDQPIDVMRFESSDQIGTAKVVKITLTDHRTICTYQLISLYNIN
ncbi:uncharacterized protein DUF2584 [Melghiribacillus thermohalophilus]|uniref:Uncharacterized protein DUF2584 n=1 Tax=Melghiribacillus thermohalophilus TaxID=1324956 RepID=A0A4R3N832_9BACI|nr:DUF2584 family protein [Melghiribacillus thermohalophilus]TCT25503.1 uncharacterized protein DUF2584 [Melghiribacillus thermohalophilus]